MLARNHKNGFSLIEVMISVGMLAIVAVLYTSHTNSNKKQETESTAITNASTQADQFINSVLRDVRYRDQPGQVFCPPGTFCTSLSFIRAKDTVNTYQVDYQNHCTAIPNKFKALFPTAFNDPNNKTIKCFSANPCPVGQYPQISINPAPSFYPTGLLPDWTSFISGGRSLRQNPIGAAFCLENTGEVTKFYVDTAILDASGKLKFISKLSNLGGDNASQSTMVVLPGN